MSRRVFRPRVMRTILRIAARDFRRRPAQSSLVVGGLLVSSLVISAALVAGDSMEALFVRTTLGAWGPLDVVVGSSSGADFPEEHALDLSGSPQVKAASDGAAPRLLFRAAAENLTKKTRESSMRLIGIDPHHDASLGDFVDDSGKAFDVGPGEVLINSRLARSLRASEGDSVAFTAAGRGFPVRVSAKVSAILPDAGKADYERLPDAFVDLGTLQTAAGMQQRVNQLVVSAKGDDPSDARLRELKAAVDSAAASLAIPLEVVSSKSEDLEDSKEQTRFFRAILGMLGTIVALASIALIANLFVMLGEERRSERGAMRALGLTRAGSIALAVAEGIFYSAAAAVFGAVIGASLGRYLADAMGDLFETFAGTSGFEFVRAPFEMRAETLLAGGTAGFIVSLLSVLAVSIRTSRMNIVSAIKGLPNDGSRRRKRVPWRQVVVIALGAAGLMGPDILKVLGGGLVIVGSSSLLSRFTSTRMATTLGGIAGLAWGFWTNTFLADFEQDPEASFAMVTAAGVVTVVAAVTLITSNLDLVRRAAPALGARTGSVFRIAAAYTSGFRFRTAMSMSMFGLVVYMIAAFAIWGGFGGSDVTKQKGGFDLLARSTVPIPDLRADAAAVVGMNLTVYQAGYRVEDSQEVRFPVRMYGVGSDMARHSRFSFAKKPQGRTAAQVWEQLVSDEGSVVLDQASAPGETEVGDTLTLKTDTGPRRLEVIGVADEVSLGGIFVSEKVFAQMFPARTGKSSWLIKALPGKSLEDLATGIEERYAEFGLDARSIEEIFAEAASAQRSFVGIFQLLLKLGLVIGISGLAIGAVRTVLERRQAIGILRAMGFGRGMIAGWLVMETLLVATLGVLTGLTVGLVGTFWLISEQVPSFDFSVDRGQITSTLIIIYSAVLLFTAIPAGRAASLKPSEAVRYVE